MGPSTRPHTYSTRSWRTTAATIWGGGFASGGVATDSAFNLIGNAGSAGGLVNGVNGNIVGADPKLGPLADNGGPTQTMALLPGSPALNAGSNALIPAGVTTDQRGGTFSRIWGGGTVDIGAFEVQDDPPTITGAPDVTVNEGSTPINVGGYDDPQGGDTVTVTASLGTLTYGLATWFWYYTPSDSTNGPTTV